jgi:hypothetical protein
MTVFYKDHFIMPDHTTSDKKEAKKDDGHQQASFFPAPVKPAILFFFFGFYEIMKAVHKNSTKKYQQKVSVKLCRKTEQAKSFVC